MNNESSCEEYIKQLEKCSAELKAAQNDLKRKTIALAEVLHQLELEKQDLYKKVDTNIQKILLPVIDRLIDRSSSIDSRYLLMLRQNLLGLASSTGIKLTKTEFTLTPKEIELCTLIKGGFSIKEISAMQNLSERTVETHRYNIRKKLGLSSSKISLSAYLSNI